MAPRFTDYYEILGVSFDATTKQITSQYRKLARMYHPDVNSEQNAETKFKIIAEAYEILSHPPSREDFDTHYEEFHKIPPDQASTRRDLYCAASDRSPWLHGEFSEILCNCGSTLFVVRAVHRGVIVYLECSAS